MEKENQNKPSVLLLWLLNNKRNSWILLASIVLLTLSLFLILRSSDNYPFISAQKSYQLWVSSNESKHYEDLKKHLKNYSELKQKYQAKVAQILIDKNQQLSDIPNDCLARLEKELPFYGEFAKNSLLISKQEYSKALENSLTLKEKMESEGKGNQTVYKYNLIRIAFLHQLLNHSTDELLVWDQVKQIPKQILPLKEGTISLDEYILARKNELKAKV